MASLRGPGMRTSSFVKTGVSSDPQSIVNLLESDEPLPDDDPSTRRGGLNPRRQADLSQISTYAQLRQQGAISDKAWQRLIERNPHSAVLFSSINPSQDAMLAKSRAQIGQQYFSPESIREVLPARGPTDVYEGDGNEQVSYPARDAVNQKIPAKADIQGATLAALSKGDLDFASKLSGLSKHDNPYGKIDPKDYTPESLTKFSTSGNVADLVPREKPENANNVFKNEESLRDNFRNLAKDYIQVRDSYGRIQESAKNPSAAGDLALIFNFMKMLDPGSTVREGEFATAQNSAGVSDRVRAMYNKAITGERLADTTRADFVSRSEALYKRQLSTHKKLEGQYRSLAKQYKLDPNRVVMDLTADEQPTPVTEITKVVGGKTYVKRADGWYEK